MCACACAAHKCNNFKGSIYMVFDYMDHDLTGLMERLNHKLPTPVVISLSQHALLPLRLSAEVGAGRLPLPSSAVTKEPR